MRYLMESETATLNYTSLLKTAQGKWTRLVFASFNHNRERCLVQCDVPLGVKEESDRPEHAQKKHNCR
ncbi:hypothetical protein AVEN_146363-1, partial [Araneus ventricosus]